VLQREAQVAAQSLRQFARRGRIVPERNDERLRELIVGSSYRLLYRIVSDDEVHVIGFVHSARDMYAFLDDENRE
jgi:plasmid stabilization system protein ParE